MIEMMMQSMGISQDDVGEIKKLITVLNGLPAEMQTLRDDVHQLRLHYGELVAELNNAREVNKELLEQINDLELKLSLTDKSNTED